MDTPRNTTKIVGALLIGLAAGAVLGILFAPDKGSETRKKFTGKADDLVDQFKKESRELLGITRRELDALREEASRIS